MKKLLITIATLTFITNVPVNAESNHASSDISMHEKLEKDPIEFGDQNFEVKVIDVYLEENPEYYEGKAVVFEYEFTNLMAETQSPATTWDAYTDVTQDNDPNVVNYLDWKPNVNYPPEDSPEVKTGGTTKWAEAYKLDDEKTPITLKAFNFMGGDEWGEWEFELDDLELRDGDEEASEETASSNNGNNSTTTTASSRPSSRTKVNNNKVKERNGEYYVISPTDGIEIPVYRNPDGSYFFAPEHDPAYFAEREEAMRKAQEIDDKSYQAYYEDEYGNLYENPIYQYREGPSDYYEEPYDSYYDDYSDDWDD
ncbi:hypothetical protein CL176_01215 [Suicoccus acidiformans]|uniref:DUF5067 domain-containing protein n=1 Tax=Suicoccus acidiformans TaxID=2036206 RepID=A0A347WI36_9LACT|nr:DUF5067 domain-containing protein [Suicoccus acidiformans]AXY24743.1 hypothetical protein CL176_01215 [Suicoccus acidiformans]